MTTIYTLAIETPDGITTGITASREPVQVGDTITVDGHDSNGMPFRQAGVVVEILATECNQ